LRINRRWINFYKQGQRAIELAMSTFWARCRPDRSPSQKQSILKFETESIRTLVKLVR